MRYLGKLLFALISPSGRLSAMPFAVLALLLMGAQCAIQMQLTALGEDYPAYNAYSIGLVLLLWPAFCITSRRFHDSDKAALFLIPLMIITFASYLSAFDNLHFAGSDFDEDRNAWLWAERGRLLMQILSMAAMIAALLRAGDESDNGYGHVFYVPTVTAVARTAAHVSSNAGATTAHRKPPATVPVQTARVTVDRQDFLASGPRGKITPAESTRHRSDGFGRR
jgi:uncharacterized membrane protein YhaH (DUF805 family)